MDARHVLGGVVLFVLTFTLAAASPAAAQVTASSEMAATLAGKLEPGDRVTVTSLDGQKVKGRFVEVGAGAIRLRQDGLERHVEFAEIQKVQRTRNGLVLGTVIGLGVGLGLGAAAASYGGNEGMNASGAFLWVLGLSTAAGLGIDAAINLPRTVYDREKTMAVTPIVTPRGAGVGVRVTF